MVAPPPSGSDWARRRTPSREALHEQEDTTSTGVQGQLGKMMWEAGSNQVKSAFQSYGRIDLFRPYFDVEPKTVRNRLLQSLIPRKPSAMQIAGDFYGPLMLIFTLIALLLLTMKTSGYSIKEGTLMGTAVLTCFGYWFFTSLALYFMALIFSAEIPLAHIFSIMGYGMFGHCVVVFLTAVFHPIHSHMFFYVLLIIFAVPSSARIAIYLASKTRDRTHKLIIAGSIVFLHIVFLIYLHFGFHTVVEEFDEMWSDTVGNAAVNTMQNKQISDSVLVEKPVIVPSPNKNSVF